ncbi:MAG: hypothetical protein ABI407_07250 [Bradyrhizobium sp.]
MKLFIAVTVVGPLVFAGALPAAGQTLRNPGQSDSIRLAAISNPAERETYMQKAHGEMLIWNKKLHDFGERTQVRATDAQTKASTELNEAWTETKGALARLETVGSEDWESAKTSFKRASDKLAVAWQNIDSGKK